VKSQFHSGGIAAAVPPSTSVTTGPCARSVDDDLGALDDLRGGKASGEVVRAFEENHVCRARPVEDVAIDALECRGAVAAVQHAVASDACVGDTLLFIVPALG
jgi:hypothetical protein